MNMGDNSGGLTSVEILIAMLFIGALGGVAYSVFDKNHTVEKDSERIAVIKTLQDELDQYFVENGGYPSSLGVLHESLKENSEYLYAALDAGCTSYHLGVKLEDKENGVLLGDVDARPGESGAGCPDGGESKTDFDGADPIYDLKP